MSKMKLLALLVASMLVAGCSSLRSITMPDEENLLSGAGSLLIGGDGKKAEGFEQINLDQLLETYGLNDVKVVANAAPGDKAKFEYLRNDLQDRIIAASNQKCAAFIRMLVSSKAQTNMAWGNLATLLSGAASVTTPGSAARVLSAGSTLSSGILARYDQAYFNNLALNVVSSGISRQRDGILRQIHVSRAESMSAYPVNRAVADALNYHAACNIVSGLETAAAATGASVDLPTASTVKPADATATTPKAAAARKSAALVAR
jgi:hypothetical protein